MTIQERPIFRPLTVRNVSLRNRIVMAPMTRTASPGGIPSEPMAAYYRRRAEHGVGLIVSEGIGIDHPTALGVGSLGEGNMPELHGDAALARWREIVEGVHQAGGVIFPQLWHQGVIRTHNTGPHPEYMSSRPSGLWGPQGGYTTAPQPYLDQMLPPTTPMTDEEIVDVIAAFARSAANARDVGFDGIAIHGAHGYLPDSFFWHETNRREDRWGGRTLKERARFGAEVVKAIRAEVGDLPIMFRFSQWKTQDYDARLAQTPDELGDLLGALADAGVDIFDASTRYYHHPAFEGSPLTLAGWARKLTGLPTMAVGGIGLQNELKNSFAGEVDAVNNVPDVEARIAAGEFDLVGVGRSLISDPAWAEKVQAGEPFLPFHPRVLASVD
ncbi:12-oxophytodienoate reductase [Novosphingobium sp. CECT 9465]|uniref:oxidoreductase n=1 Tax=Novosphingobium sp. CECT 9465 TaxID=2829794 RepID=UPI001E38EA39|nr:12-oxophytodienoate reductase [Novosphingobium sp. CECT 9465]CAH0495298.1 NADH oxidase [Novosphingobium sp. CECT 9465]